MNDLEKRLRRIVCGQVRSFINDHPEKFASSIRNARVRKSVENSIAKRIVPDILTVLARVRPEPGDAGMAASSEKVPGAVDTTAAPGQALAAAIAYRAAEQDNTPRMWRGKDLHELGMALDAALEPFIGQ